MAATASVSEDQDKLLSEAKKQVNKNGFEMKSSLVSWRRFSTSVVFFLSQFFLSFRPVASLIQNFKVGGGKDLFRVMAA